ncbi:MAG: hypothetical protein E7049_06500 [Lentisphaerae bacterium]|nr:hypothetical protein [Lentisphaerota bacterium]
MHSVVGLIRRNRATLLVALLSLCLAQRAEADSQIAFPGAAGWGRFAKGARASSSPKVLHVTNLNDSGTGSLRWAVTQSDAIVVFDVAGVIIPKSTIVFGKNLYIAGQTAPGEGITVYGNRCSFSGSDNLICRYLRWRMGHIGPKGKDCAGIANGQNMIFDHCSFSWGRDETFSINPDGKGSLGNITLQNCIFGQGLMTHSAGGLMQADYITLYRNFYCDNGTRNNKLKGKIQYVNNTVYNWRSGCVILGGGSSGTSECNITGNLFIKGPAGGVDCIGGGNSGFRYYAEDNWVDADRDGAFDPSQFTGSGGGSLVSTPYNYPELEQYSARELLTRNLPTVGASLPYRDPADCYMVDEVMSYGTDGKLITYETALPIGAPSTWSVWGGDARTDTDGDGMPDAWESANGTNPNSADATTVAANGYLNIENYINSITADDSQFYLRAPLIPKSAGKTSSSISVEWRDYTQGEDGFEVSYSLNGSSGWTVAGTTAANATSYTISGLGSGAYHWVRIRAFATRNGSRVYGPYSKTAKLYTSASSAAEVDIATFAPDVTYKRVANSQPWNKTDSQYWTEGIPYQDGYQVLINQNSSGSGISLNVDETISPGAVVVNGTGTITLNGNGNLSGAACSINKGNTGHLFLYGENTYEGPVVNHDGTISFNKIANGGVASGLGKSLSFADNWIFDGGTYRFTGGTASTDRDALLRSASALEVKDKVLTMNGVFEGEGDFILQGGGTLDVPNGSFFGYTGATILRGGTLKLSDANASTGSAVNFHPTQLVMAGGSLFIASDSGYQQEQNMTLDIEVADNTTSSITIPGRGNFSGTISNASDDAGDDDEDEDGGANEDETYVYTGNEGRLRIYVPYSRGYIANDFSQFHGTIIANCTHKDGRFMKNGSWNAPTTRFYLEKSSVSGATTYMSAYPANTTNKIGGLSGDAGTYLIGCSEGTSQTPCNWIVGYANTDETFNGQINNYTWGYGASKYKANVSITKVGTGYWRLNGNTENRSGTTVDGGTLIMNATHTESGVTVNSGAMLRGKGTIKTAITVNSGATLYPGDEAESSSMTADSSVTLKGGSTMKVGNAALWANGTVYINSGVTLAVDTSVKTLKAGTEIRVFKGTNDKFTTSGTFDSIEPASPGNGLAWDTSTLYSDGYLKVYSNIPIKTYFIGGNGDYWDQKGSWDNGVPEAGVTAVFTNTATLTVNMPWYDNAVCDAIELNGADVKFHSRINWPRLSPKSVTGTGTMYLQSDINKDNSGNTAVGLVTQDASDMLVEVPVVLERASSTDIDQDIFFQGLNDHVINFFRPVTVLSGARLIAYSGMYLRGGFAVESTKWNSIRGTNTIACNLTGAGNLYLDVDAGITYFTGDNSGFTGTINQELYSNVPRFIGGASAPVNGTVNIKGDMYIIPSEYGETFRFGALNLTRSDWYFCYVMKNMGVKLEVGSKGDSFWEDGYYFGTWDGTTASTSETTDAEIVKVGAGTTLAAYAQQYDNTKISTKDGICIHPRWSQDFESAETYAAQFSGGTVASTAFGTSASSGGFIATPDQSERTIYGEETNSKFFRVYTTSTEKNNSAIFTPPAKIANATEGYRFEFDYFLSQNAGSGTSGFVIQGANNVLATVYAGLGSKDAENTNGAIYKGDSNAEDDKIITITSYGRDFDPAAEAARKYWKHYTIIGIPTGVSKGVYLTVRSSEKQSDGKPVIETMSYKLSDEYDTVAKINILALRKGYTWNRFICLDNVVASIAETGKPYIANDDGATLSGDEDSGWVLTPSAGLANVVVCIPTGVQPSTVTVRAPVDSATVTPNGANVRVVRGESDITDYLDVPAAVDGVVSIADASVKNEYVKEPLDPEKGAVIELSPESVRLVTAPTRAGLVYQLKEGETLGEMFDCEDGDSKIGDGGAWEPSITVSGGESGFYTISVGK